MKIIPLITSILICESAGIIGSVFTFSAITTWYMHLNKPWFNPPNFLFGPVWTFLYFLMGISLYLVWKKGVKNKEKRRALMVFAGQLFFNAIWSIVFFGLKSPLGGLFIIIILWLLIIETIRRFYKIDKNSSFLLMPYLVWVTFATILNFSIWVLNR
jgi:tryptophan-rich sensory protein